MKTVQCTALHSFNIFWFNIALSTFRMTMWNSLKWLDIEWMLFVRIDSSALATKRMHFILYSSIFMSMSISMYFHQFLQQYEIVIMQTMPSNRMRKRTASMWNMKRILNYTSHATFDKYRAILIISHAEQFLLIKKESWIE